MLTALSGPATAGIEPVAGARRREVAQRHAALEVVAQLADVARPGVAPERLEELGRADLAPASRRRPRRTPAPRGRPGAADRRAARAAAAASPRRPPAGNRGRSGTSAAATWSRRLRLVAATSRTLTGTWLLVPTRRTSRRSSTRRSFGCRSMLSSPISSRKTVPPGGRLEHPLPRRDRAGEGAALVTEQLALQELRRHRAAVDDQERLVLARAAEVDRLGRHLLAGAGLALEQDGRVAGGGLAEHVEHHLHRRRAPDHPAEPIVAARPRGSGPNRSPGARRRQPTLNAARASW